MLREAVRDLCAKHGDPAHLRDLEDDPVGFDRVFWDELASMDLIGLTLPVEHGGSGRTALESMVVFEQLGRAIVPSSLLVSAVVGGGVLVVAGSEEQRASWLPRIARGEAILTLAWHEAGRSDGPDGVALSVAAEGDDLVLQAAWARATSGTGGPFVALTKRFACETYRRATRVGHQVFGGIGFTRAIDVQLYFRRAKQLEPAWAEPRTLAEQVAAAELDTDQPLVTLDAGI